MSRFRSDYRPAWTHEEKMALIEMAEKFQVLWDTSYPFFRELTQRKHALEEIYTVLDGRHTVEDINAQWRNLKDVFHKKKALVEQMARPGEPTPDPPWRYYAPLKFLLSCEEERKNNLRKRFEGSYEIAQLRQMRFRRQTEIAARRKQREDETALTDRLADVDGGCAVDAPPPSKRPAGSTAGGGWPAASSQPAYPRSLHAQRIPRRPPGAALVPAGTEPSPTSLSGSAANVKLEEEGDFHVSGHRVRQPMNLDAWARPTRRGQPLPAVQLRAFSGSTGGPTRPAIISSGAAVPAAAPPSSSSSTSAATAAAFPSAVVVKTETIEEAEGEKSAESPPAVHEEAEREVLGPTDEDRDYVEDEKGNEDSGDAIECLQPMRSEIDGPFWPQRDYQTEPDDDLQRFMRQRRGSPLSVGERLARWHQLQRQSADGQPTPSRRPAVVGTTAVVRPKPAVNGSATASLKSAGGVNPMAPMSNPVLAVGLSSSAAAGVDKFKYFAQYVESAVLDINQQSPALARRLVQDVYASVAEYQAMLR